MVEDAVATGRLLKQDMAKLQTYDPSLEIKVVCLKGAHITEGIHGFVEYC